MYFLHSRGVPNPTPRKRVPSPQQAFGARVRALRLAADMTQEDLAEHSGLFRTYMSRIETGQANPTLTMIHALAVALSVHPAVLLSDEALPISPDSETSNIPSSTAMAARRNRKLGNPPSRGRTR